MEALDTILYEEGTQVPLNPHTTSSQVSHKDTTVEKALEDEDLRIDGLRKIVIWSVDNHDTIQQKVDRFLAADGDSSVMYFNDGRKDNPGNYVPLVAYKIGKSYQFTGYYPANEVQGTPGFSPVNWYRVIIYLSGGRWAETVTPGKFLTTGEYQKFTAGEQQEIKTNIDAGSKAIRINYGNATAAAAAIEQFNNDPQRTVILVNYKNIRCVATVSFTTLPFMVAYVPEGTNMRKLLFKDGAWSESVIYHDTVRYNKQTLTEAQKAQARGNINALEDEAGVIDTEHIATGAVTTDKLVQGAVLNPLEIDLYGITNGSEQLKELQKQIAEAAKTNPGSDKLYVLVTENESDWYVGALEVNSYAQYGILSKIAVRNSYDPTEDFDKMFMFFNSSVDAKTLHISYFNPIDKVVPAPTLDTDAANKEYVDGLVNSVKLTDTISSNKAQLDAYLGKIPNAQVMHCTYKEIWAGTLHKINDDWYGLLVKNTNNYEDALQVKLQADGTLVEGTSSLAEINTKLDNIIG